MSVNILSRLLHYLDERSLHNHSYTSLSCTFQLRVRISNLPKYFPITETFFMQFNVLTQHYDSVSRTTSNVKGVHTRIPGFGDTYNIEYLDNLALVWPYFKVFVRRMSELGYKAGVSLRSAPFDPRKGPSKSKIVCILLLEKMAFTDFSWHKVMIFLSDYKTISEDSCFFP